MDIHGRKWTVTDPRKKEVPPFSLNQLGRILRLTSNKLIILKSP